MRQPLRSRPDRAGLAWSQVAQVCPRDGATPCAGTVGGKSLTGWVWGTDAHVQPLMGAFEPAVLAADPPSVSGPEYFLRAGAFLGEMRWTNSFASTSGPDTLRTWTS